MSHTTLSSRIVTALIGVALASVALAPSVSAHHGTVSQADGCSATPCSTGAETSEQPGKPIARPGSAVAPAAQAAPDESSNQVNWLYPAVGAALGAGVLLILITRGRSRHARRAGIPAATS
jgi:hypothetical protein